MVSKLKSRIYETFYHRPLARFFQDYWRDEKAINALLQEVKQRVLKNPEDQEKFINFVNANRNLQRLLMEASVNSDDLVNWLHTDPQAFLTLTKKITENPDLFAAFIATMVGQELLQSQFIDWLKSDMAHMRQFVTYLENDAELRHEFVKISIHRKLVEREEFIRWVNHEDGNLEQYIKYLNRSLQLSQRFTESITQSGILQKILPDWVAQDPNRLRDFLAASLQTEAAQKQFIQFLMRDEGLLSLFIESLAGNNARQASFANVVKENYPNLTEQLVKGLLGTAKPIEQFFAWLWMEEGNQRRLITELRSNPDLRGQLYQLLQADAALRDEFNQTMWQDVGIVNDFLDYLSTDAEKRKAFLRELNGRDSYRSALNIMHEKEITGNLSYELPTVTSSFPRSGSNFFQSVLRGSSGLQCLSLYHPQYPVEQVYNLKSHALTPQALAREFADMVPYELEYPERIVYLKRDPRDVMISLYEFACFNHQQEFSLEGFLGMNYYYIANPPAKRDVKMVYYLPGPETCTVAEAYQLFTRAHFKEAVHPDGVETLLLSYEGMVDDPYGTFQQAFDFLDLQCTLNPELIRLKVSQYSESKRERGVAYGWKQPETQDIYQPLIEQVNQFLKEEIAFLGYNLWGCQPGTTADHTLTGE